jgi:hypothetical protein
VSRTAASDIYDERKHEQPKDIVYHCRADDNLGESFLHEAEFLQYGYGYAHACRSQGRCGEHRICEVPAAHRCVEKTRDERDNHAG